ncbi:hypothetical protein BHE74_00054837 [Ensete ventricosum]|nr:hypothetical protein BHE74_00054837 [Ensete ventricosum]
MESLEHAMKRDAPIIAEYLGGAVNCDAHHMTEPRADGLGVSSCIRKSLEDAGVAPEEVICVSSCLLTKMFCIQVNYINAHATSTVVGDLAEINAAKQVFKNPSEIKMNATKNPEPAIEFDTVANKKQQHEVNVGNYIISLSLHFCRVQ